MLRLTLLAALVGNICPPVKGRIKFVQSHQNPDYRVFIEDNNADMKVMLVDSFPNTVGKWQDVNYNEDYRIQIVNNKALADFTISFVGYNPGCRKNRFDKGQNRR